MTIHDFATGTPDRHTPMRQCACGAAYRDTDDSRTAHHTVFGHRPIRKPAPEQGDQT